MTHDEKLELVASLWPDHPTLGCQIQVIALDSTHRVIGNQFLNVIVQN